ncbi:hypothetical protein D9M69_647280 [compost metagenome]
MAGCTGKPLAVTSWPSRSVWNEPSRVYEVVPSGISTWKKPLPLMATSVGLSVLVRLPCEWMRSVATTCTPVPTCRPEGRRVWSELWPPTWRRFW